MDHEAIFFNWRSRTLHFRQIPDSFVRAGIYECKRMSYHEKVVGIAPVSTYILNMDISVVIPVLNEAMKIANDMQAAARYMENRHLHGEIIVVDDGSIDGTPQIAEAVSLPSLVERHVVRCLSHHGKGHAVKVGMVRSKGDIALFIDSGSCIHYDDVDTGIRMVEKNECDIAHASRYLPESTIVRQHRHSRRLTSLLFRKMLTVLMRVPSDLTDTQCGLKIYRGDVGRQLYSQCITDGFMFDIEIILRASKQNLCIREFPVQWHADLDSRLSQMKMPLHILISLIKIRQALSST